VDDVDLYPRGFETQVASWEANARSSNGASVVRSPGVAVAVFPNEPERTVYNNALLARGLDTRDGHDARRRRLPRPVIELGPPDWFECLRILELGPDFLHGADHAAFHVLIARLGGENVATAMAGSITSQRCSAPGGADWARR